MQFRVLSCYYGNVKDGIVMVGSGGRMRKSQLFERRKTSKSDHWDAEGVAMEIRFVLRRVCAAFVRKVFFMSGQSREMSVRSLQRAAWSFGMQEQWLGYWLDDRGSTPARGKTLFSSPYVQTGSGVFPSLAQWVRRFCPEGKAAGRWSWPLTLG